MNEGYGDDFAPIYDILYPPLDVDGVEISWLSSWAPEHNPVVVELGVGTGRVLLPLEERLRKRRPRCLGIDASEAMLSALRTKDPHDRIVRVRRDICQELPPLTADLVLCVGGTISMLLSREQQQRALENAAAALRPGGYLLVETHTADRVHALHPRGTSTRCTETADGRVVVTFSEVSGINWDVTTVLVDRETSHHGRERSLVTSTRDLDSLAGAAGLRPAGTFAGLTPEPPLGMPPTTTHVYRRRSASDGSPSPGRVLKRKERP